MHFQLLRNISVFKILDLFNQALSEDSCPMLMDMCSESNNPDEDEESEVAASFCFARDRLERPLVDFKCCEILEDRRAPAPVIEKTACGIEVIDDDKTGEDWEEV